MGHHGAKCTQIDESMCQGVICTCQNFFLFTNLAAGVTFLKVILQLLQKCTNLVIPDFSGCFFIFVTTSISHIPPSPLVQCTALSINAWRILVQQKQDFDQNLARVVVFPVPVLHIFLSVIDSAGISIKPCHRIAILWHCGSMFCFHETIATGVSWHSLHYCNNNLAHFYDVNTAFSLVEPSSRQK